MVPRPSEPSQRVGTPAQAALASDPRLGIQILDKVRGLHAPVASIGGAGTFDGIFVTGILAVLLVPATGPARPAQGIRSEPTDDLGRRGLRNDSTDPAVSGGV